jgi:hypothetical protein
MLLFIKKEIFFLAGILFKRYSNLKASIFVRFLFTATISTGSLPLVYFDADPSLCFLRRFSRLFVTPQYKELSEHLNKYTFQFFVSVLIIVLNSYHRSGMILQGKNFKESMA